MRLMDSWDLKLAASHLSLRVCGLCCGFTGGRGEGALLSQSLPRGPTAVDDVIGGRFGLRGCRGLLGCRRCCLVARVSSCGLPGILSQVIASASLLLTLSAGAVLSAATCSGANPFLYLVDVAQQYGAVRLGVSVIANRLPVDVGRVTLLFFAVAIEVFASLTCLKAVNQSLGEGVIR